MRKFVRSALGAVALLALGTQIAIASPTYGGQACTVQGDCSISLNMTYNGGPVMTSPVTIDYLWYGSYWSTSAGKNSENVLKSFANDLSGSDYMKIASYFTDGNGKQATTQVKFGQDASAATTKSSGTISSTTMENAVTQAISAGKFAQDYANTIYFVMLAPTLNSRDSSGDNPCGEHYLLNGLHFAFVRSVLGCDSLSQTGQASGDKYADSASETMSHELMESLTDPDSMAQSGWTDPTYGEVGDMCQNTNFAEKIGKHTYDVQSIFVPDNTNGQGGYCAHDNASGSVIDVSQYLGSNSGGGSNNSVPHKVPEPSMLALFGLGLAFTVRRKTSRR